MEKTRHVLIGVVLSILIYYRISIYYLIPLSLLLILFYYNNPSKIYFFIGVLLIVPSLIITDTPKPLTVNEEIEVTGKIIKKYNKYTNYQRIDIQTDDRIIALSTDGSVGLEEGDLLKAQIMTKSSNVFNNFGLKNKIDYDWKDYVSDYAELKEYSIYKKGGFLSQSRNRLISRVENRVDNLSPINRGVVKKLLLGTNDDLDLDLKEKFSLLSLSHILAISGLHIGILMAIVETIFKRLKISYSIRVLVIFSLTLFYAYILGFSPSVMRVLLMYTVTKLTEVSKIRTEDIDIVFAALIINLIFSPRQLYDVGLLLSYGATLGLIIFYKRMNVSESFISKSVYSYISVHLIILPILIIYFNNFNLIGMIANILIAPVFIALIPMSMAMIILNNHIIYSMLDLMFDSVRYYIDILSNMDLTVKISNPNILMVI